MSTLIATLAATLYLSYATVMFLRQRALLYPGACTSRDALAVSPDDAELVTLDASFGPACAIFLPATAKRARGRAPAILFLHGNSQFADELIPSFGTVRALGMHVLLVEYPGYGTPGVPGFDTLRETSNLAYDWLVADRRVDRSRIVAMGASLGGGPAAQLTADRPIAALVLIATFAELGQFARERFLPGLLVRDRFDNLARVRAFRGAVLVVHGRRDDVIPFASAEALARATPHARLVALDCGHDVCEQLDRVALAIRAFLRDSGVLGNESRRMRRRIRRAVARRLELAGRASSLAEA
jgi:uncharacterized protein